VFLSAKECGEVVSLVEERNGRKMAVKSMVFIYTMADVMFKALKISRPSGMRYPAWENQSKSNPTLLIYSIHSDRLSLCERLRISQGPDSNSS
jgi:hypothetical protein